MIVGLYGNQNSGKTTLFNELTGSNQKVGNWPGVTIEKKEGRIKGSDIEIVDLPGIYSLSPYTLEEEVSRKFLFEEKVDVILNIIDSTSIERSLYLTTQLLETGIDTVIALNMVDILESHGINIDIDKLSDALGVTIIKISAKNGTNIDNLISTIKEGNYKKNSHLKIYPNDVEELIDEISSSFSESIENKRFASVKIIEHDRAFQILNNEILESRSQDIEKKYDMDGEQLIASLRYQFIESILKDSVKHTKREDTITDKLDKILLNKYLAIPIFIVIMALVYLLTVGVVGRYTVDLIDSLFNGSMSTKGLGPLLEELILNNGGSPISASLVSRGIIAGVGAVCNFIPQIIVLFTLLAILETSGYMSRISFFLDRVFHKFGLSGKSLVPFIVGSGCSVPAIMSCRTIEDKDERHLSILLTPFIPCNAKLPIIVLFSSFFFGSSSWLVSFSLYLIAFLIILLSGYILKKLFYKGHESTFVSELPEYKLPSFKYVFKDVYDKTLAFIKRAGTIIFIFSVIVWFLSSFTWRFEYVDGESILIDNSILASIGNAFSWFFYFILGGNNSWAASVSAIQGLVAKEQVISSMSVIAKVSDNGAIFNSQIFNFFTPITAYAYMVFNIFSAPCIGAISTMKKEFGNYKDMFKAVLFQTLLAWVLGSLIGLVQLLISI